MMSILLVSCNNNVQKTGPLEGFDNYYNGKTFVHKGLKKQITSDITYEDRGLTLKTKLHHLVMYSHSTYVPYSDFKKTEVYKKTCWDPDKQKIISFYTGKEVTSYLSSMNREHVWAAANSSFLFTHDEAYKGTPYYLDESYKGAGADMYHIMPANAAVNQARGNSEFMEIPAGRQTTKLTDGGPYALLNDGTKVQPDDHFKGDIARIAMYIYVHYNAFGDRDEYTIPEGKGLKLTNIITPSEGETVEQTICRWNKIDPPDAMEKYRNDQVEKVQGNRNPFIDFPELANMMFEIDM